MSSPFEVDSQACTIAQRYGFELTRRDVIEVVDEAALFHTGMVATKPDYARIRRALAAGIPVAGVVLRGIEYVLRPRKHDQ